MKGMNQRMSVTRKADLIEREGGVDIDLLSRILRSSLKVTIEGMDDKGDIFFFVPIKSIGLTKSELSASSSIIRTRFFTDFVGELLIRYNIDDFVRYMLEMVDPNQYLMLVSRTRHDHFGVFILEEEEALRFQFHISFLQQILSEDINRVVK
jgi:hypothetical protein